MNALLRKDLPWLAGFAVAGAVIELLVLGSQEAGHFWIVPDARFGAAVVAFHWSAASILGLWSALFDDVARTPSTCFTVPSRPPAFSGTGSSAAGWSSASGSLCPRRCTSLCCWQPGKTLT